MATDDTKEVTELDIIEQIIEKIEPPAPVEELRKSTRKRNKDTDDGLIEIYHASNTHRTFGVKGPRTGRQYKHDGSGALRVEPIDAEALVKGGVWTYGG